MLGIDGVTAATVARLRDEAPGKLAELRTRLDRDRRALPDPTEILDYEPGQIEIGRWPLWYVQTVGQAPTPRIDELGQAATVYGYRYTTRVYAWLRGPDHTAESAMRNHLLAAQEILLAQPVLLDPDPPGSPYPGQHARIETGSISARTGAPEPARGKDTICAGYIEMRVATVETLGVPPTDITVDPDATTEIAQ